MITTKFNITGMTCSACSNTITKEIEKISGVKSAHVSLLTEEAVIHHDETVTVSQLKNAIDDLGFEPSFISSIIDEAKESSERNYLRTRIHIEGMTCANCSNTIVNSIKQLEGVRKIDVSLLAGEATILHGKISPNKLVDEIEDLGFEAKLMSSEQIPAPAIKLKTELTIEGMTCSACVNSITNVLKSIQGVEFVNVSLMTEMATVIHDDSVKVDLLLESIADAGFDASIIQVTEMNASRYHPDIVNDILTCCLHVYGIKDEEDVTKIKNAVLELDGILDCDISSLSAEVKIEYNSNVIGVRAILKVLTDLGFDAIISNKLDTTSQIDLLAKIKEVKYWRSIFLKLLLFGIPIILAARITPVIRQPNHWGANFLELIDGVYVDILVQWTLSSYVQFILGKQFYINSYKSLKHGSGNMDVLICVSTSIVYFYSVFSIMNGFFRKVYPNVLFDTSAMLLIFISLGKWVESKAKGNTSTALSKLLSLTPTTCIILEDPHLFKTNEKGGFDASAVNQIQVSVDLLQRGDIAVVLPGSKVPSDGECIFGSSEMDESFLTGESSPVTKHVGSPIIGGSVNITSTIYMKVTEVGEQTQLQQIVKLVKDAQTSTAPIQRFADYIASIFVPSILIFSLMTLIFWSCYTKIVSIDKVPKMLKNLDGDKVEFFKILQIAISVIVVACPCALGLAAPTAVMVGTGVGARNGVLIKGGEVLEKANDIDAVIFDKTGTLTKGVMEINSFEFYGDYEHKETFIWSLINAVELNSEHPLAKALVKSSLDELAGKQASQFELKLVESLIGKGITAVVVNPATGKDINVRMGNSRLMDAFKIVNKGKYDETIEKLAFRKNISSFCHILIDDAYIGYVELLDTLNPESKHTIETFIKCGYSVGIVTGDAAETASYVGGLLNIPSNNIFAEATPEEKLEYIKSLQENKGLKVAFVGDGINDAPALVQSDLGIAISTGTDIAMSAADIVLLTSSNDSVGNSRIGLFGVYASLDISRSTFNTIKLNFLLAVIYNMIMLPIAMGFLLIPFNVTMHPMFASAAMACSSTSVIINSLTLNRWSMEKLKKKVNESIEWKNTTNLGWNDGMADTRGEVTELSTESFIVNRNYKHKSIPIFSRVWRRIRGAFRRNDYERVSVSV